MSKHVEENGIQKGNHLKVHYCVSILGLNLCPQFQFENYATEKQATKGPSIEAHLMNLE